MFDLVEQITCGGLGSITELTSIELQHAAFENWRTGYASAYAMILFVTVFGLASIYVKSLDRVEARRAGPSPTRRRARNGSRVCSSSPPRSSRPCRCSGSSPQC